MLKSYGNYILASLCFEYKCTMSSQSFLYTLYFTQNIFFVKTSIFIQKKKKKGKMAGATNKCFGRCSGAQKVSISLKSFVNNWV